MVEDELITEAGSDPHAGYESRATSELVELMNAEDASVPEAVRAAAPASPATSATTWPGGVENVASHTDASSAAMSPDDPAPT